MARPREFDEELVLDAMVRQFWGHGYQSTSIRDLSKETGLTAASLYNAFGDKHSAYQSALRRYINTSILDRISRCEALSPEEALKVFFAEIVKRSLGDPDHKGCMIVNAALEVAPHDAEFRKEIAEVLRQLEAFFFRCVLRGQSEGTFSKIISPERHAQHLLGVLMGIRVLSRVRPERALLNGIVAAALLALGRTSPHAG